MRNIYTTEGMRMDVCSDMETSVFDQFPRLLELPEVARLSNIRGKFPERAMRYIIIYYSHDSTLRNIVPPLSVQQRKEAAAEMAGFKRRERLGFDDDVVERLFKLSDPSVLEAVIAFLRVQDDSGGLFALLHTLEQNYWENLALLNRALEGNDDSEKVKQLEMKNKVRQHCKELLSDIEEYTNRFYGRSLEIRAEIERKKKEHSQELDINRITL